MGSKSMRRSTELLDDRREVIENPFEHGSVSRSAGILINDEKDWLNIHFDLRNERLIEKAIVRQFTASIFNRLRQYGDEILIGEEDDVLILDASAQSKDDWNQYVKDRRFKAGVIYISNVGHARPYPRIIIHVIDDEGEYLIDFGRDALVRGFANHAFRRSKNFSRIDRPFIKDLVIAHFEYNQLIALR